MRSHLLTAIVSALCTAAVLMPNVSARPAEGRPGLRAVGPASPGGLRVEENGVSVYATEYVDAITTVDVVNPERCFEYGAGWRCYLHFGGPRFPVYLSVQTKTPATPQTRTEP